jgi:hypothetical protein
LVDCPNCGTEVATAIKCWTVSPAKYTAKGYTPEFRVGIFKCPKCQSKFRSKVNSMPKPVEIDVKDRVSEIKGIHHGLALTLRTLREKIKILERERWDLMVEIEELKRVADSRVNALETEVNQLREELKLLKEVLDANEDRG